MNNFIGFAGLFFRDLFQHNLKNFGKTPSEYLPIIISVGRHKLLTFKATMDDQMPGMFGSMQPMMNQLMGQTDDNFRPEQQNMPLGMNEYEKV